MLKTLSLLVLAAALATCSPPAEQAETPPAQSADAVSEEAPPTEPPPRGIEFRAVGQEPGWMLDITSIALDLTLDYGETHITLPAHAPRYPQEGVTRYESRDDAHTLTVTITRTPCQDSMSGAAYPARVSIMIDGRTLEGCGRS